MKKKKKYARNAVQLRSACDMLVYLGIICRENMQIEGFWYYLFLGVFEAATIHYLVAKILGPCCWTRVVRLCLLDCNGFGLAAIQDACGSPKALGSDTIYCLRCFACVCQSAFIFQVPYKETMMWWSFIIGNVIYYAIGILMAFQCKDNRAFCKYICPITVFLKP